MVARSWNHVDAFRQRLEERGLTPAVIQSIDDIAKLPFTQKNDLRDTYPFGLFASPMKDVVRLHASSGTTGKPIVVAYTQEDVDVWTSSICAVSCGLRPASRRHYSGGLRLRPVYRRAGRALRRREPGRRGGAGLRRPRRSPDHADERLRRDGGLLHAQLFLHLIERAGEMGIDMKHLPIRVGVFGAEPWTESMRQVIESTSGVEAFDIYGLSEIIGPGVGCECRRHQGLHIFEDLFYPEVIDPETGEPLPDGEMGELVLTTLAKQAMPMIRYRTRDITSILPGRCACGRTIRRIDRIGRRSDDMLIIRGVNVFPSQVESALLEGRGHAAALPDSAHARTRPGPDGSAGRGHAADVRRQDRSSAGAESAPAGRARSRARNPRPRHAGRGALDRTQRGQSQTRHRQADIMKIKQISLFAENKQGHIAAPVRLLAQDGVDIRALVLAETQQYGILRMIVSDWQKAADAA